MFLWSSSIGIQKDLFLFNHWPRYERSREVPVWNSFYSASPIGLFMSFPPPSRMIHMKNKRRRERKDKNTGGGSERHKQIYYRIIPSLHQSHSPKYLIRNFSSSRSGKLRLKIWYTAKYWHSFVFVFTPSVFRSICFCSVIIDYFSSIAFFCKWRWCIGCSLVRQIYYSFEELNFRFQYLVSKLPVVTQSSHRKLNNLARKTKTVNNELYLPWVFMKKTNSFSVW